MADPETALSEGADLLEDLAPLLAVPTVISLLNVGELGAVLSHRGGYIGIEFPFPVPVGDLWTFVNTPDAGSGVSVTGYGFAGGVFPLPVALLVAIGYLLLYGLLAAGYVGSIQEYRGRGTYDFLANARRYVVRYITLTAIIFGLFLLALPFALVVPPLVLLVALALLVIGYLFWGAWFLVPVADVGVIEGLTRSYNLATTESDYAIWSLVHLAVGGGVSLFATWVAVSASIFGILIALVLVIPIGFVLTVGSLRTIDDLQDNRRPPRANPEYDLSPS